MKNLNFLLLLAGFMIIPKKAKAQTNTEKYIKVPAGYLMVLRQGDNVLAQIEEMAKKERIPSANFTGMGFVNVEFGFFNFKTKKYEPKEFKDVELAGMTGSIAWQNDSVSLHTHGIVTDKNFNAFGGHMLAATVGTGSVEILITVHSHTLERVMDQSLGANVLSLEHH
ncbi:PPC domain-containing DNA-binding protein [Dyadobacter sp. NIV53]|uniref:PPC domain-containing DNA-binding protein n=1 Tax=Dyadobacter sp. NIV53 TaxID=2861765 RepID=UPI001C878A74|nr:PPC domain-containing DNA-binding protein [Dyadobacter sp. NIV53]